MVVTTTPTMKGTTIHQPTIVSSKCPKVPGLGCNKHWFATGLLHPNLEPHSNVVAETTSLYPRIVQATTTKGESKVYGGDVHPI